MSPSLGVQVDSSNHLTVSSQLEMVPQTNCSESYVGVILPCSKVTKSSSSSDLSSMQVLPAVSLEQEDSVDDSTLQQTKSATRKKRNRDNRNTITNEASNKVMKRSPSSSLSAVVSASVPPSSAKRRSPRKHRRHGENEADLEARVAVESAAAAQDETASSVETPPTISTTRQPLFSKDLAPHQQHAIFSPGALRTPHKSASKSMAKRTATPRTSPSCGILRKMTPIQVKVAAATLSTRTEPAASESNIAMNDTSPEESDHVVTNLARTMEDNVHPAESNIQIQVPTALSETHVCEAAIETTMLEPAHSNTPTFIDVEELQYRLSLLFPPQKYPHMQTKPCILPRIIASYTLHKDFQDEQSHQATSMEVTSCNSGVETCKLAPKVTTRRRKRSMDSKTHAIQRIQPIRNFLDALVDLEWNLLEEPTPQDTSKSSFSAEIPRKRVHFAAFDGSALCPPNDVTEGSHRQQETCIQNLTSILDAVKNMAMGDHNGARSHILATLRDIVFYLDQDFRLYYHDKTCARSISKEKLVATFTTSGLWYPTRRVEKAAAMYSRDLESLIEYLKSTTVLSMSSEDQALAKSTSSLPSSRPLLIWECRMADVSSQLVRYWLRTLLNPVPGRAVATGKTERWNTRFAELVILVENTNSAFLGEASSPGSESDDESAASSTAVDDGSLSSLLSDALSHIYDYLGGIPLNYASNGSHGLVAASGEVWRQRLLQVLPDASCLSSDRCSLGIGTGRSPALPLTDLEWKQVGDELQVASDFVAFFHRVVFLEQLVTILLGASDWASHWENTVQVSAHRLIELQKSTIGGTIGSVAKSESSLDTSDMTTSQVLQQEDAHMVLLGIPLKELLSRIQNDLLPLASTRYDEIKASMQKTVAAFRLGKSNTKHKKQYQPQVGELEEYWNDLLEGIVFPSIAKLLNEN